MIDVTTAKGIQIAAKKLSAVELATVLLTLTFTLPALAVNALYKGVQHWNSRNSGIPTDQQVQAVQAIIRAGRVEGACVIKVKANKEVGLALGGHFEGLPIRTFLGRSGEFIIEVKYK